jgi:hypothetical protein
MPAPALPRPPAPSAAPRPIVGKAPIAAGSGGATAGTLALRDPVAKKVGPRGAERELRRLTPEEKQQRRFRRNIIMLTGGLGFLMLVLWLLTR